MNTKNVANAVENLLRVFFDDEMEDFVKQYDSSKDFMTQFLDHNLHDFVVLKFLGDDDKVLEWVEEFRTEHDLISDVEDEYEDELEDVVEC